MIFSSFTTTLQMVAQAFEHLLQGGSLPNLGYWDYLLLALFSAIQGPVATLLGGTAAAAGIVAPMGVFLSISAGNLIVDFFWYSVGRTGKIEWLFGSNRLLKAPRQRVEALRKIIVDQSSTVMTLAKITTGFVMPTMIATGLARVPWKRWFPPLFIVELLRTGALVWVGYYSARALGQVLKGYSYLTVFGTVIMVGLSGWVIYRTLHLDQKLEPILTDKDQ